MKTNIIFKDEQMIDVVLTINLASLAAAVAATKDRIEGRNKRGRPFKLNSMQLLEVKQLLADGMPQTQIAARFGITQATVSNIANTTFDQEVQV